MTILIIAISSFLAILFLGQAITLKLEDETALDKESRIITKLIERNDEQNS